MAKVMHKLLMRSYNSCFVVLRCYKNHSSFCPFCNAFYDSLAVKAPSLMKFRAGMGEL